MTLDPTIESRVRAKRAHPLDQDHDALALYAEVERLRDAIADEHAGRCGDQLDLAGACAERDAAREAVKIVDANLMEQRARAENLEKALSIAATERQRVLSAIADAMHGPTLQPLADRVRGYVETCDRLGREKAEALAACAEMRAWAEMVLSWARNRDRTILDHGAVEQACLQALARPDIGAGVVVPREVVERVRSALRGSEEQMCAVPPRGHGCVCGCVVIDGHTGSCIVARALADLDALLGKAKP